MSDGKPITIRAFIEPDGDGGYLAGFKDEHDDVFGAVVPIAPELVEVAVLSELTLVPHMAHDDGTVGITSRSLDEETYMALFRKRTVLGKLSIDALVIDAMDVVDNAPEALADLQLFKQRLQRALAAVEAKIDERTPRIAPQVRADGRADESKA